MSEFGGRESLREAGQLPHLLRHAPPVYPQHGESQKTRGRSWEQPEGKIPEWADLTLPGVSYLPRFFLDSRFSSAQSGATKALRYRFFFCKRLAGNTDIQNTTVYGGRDPSFGSDGTISTGLIEVHSRMIQPDGKLIIPGSKILEVTKKAVSMLLFWSDTIRMVFAKLFGAWALLWRWE